MAKAGTVIGWKLPREERAALLGRRRCTTHHELVDALRRLAPQARVIDNRVFVVDGPVASSAGITAGIDVALHLIGEGRDQPRLADPNRPGHDGDPPAVLDRGQPLRAQPGQVIFAAVKGIDTCRGLPR